MVVIDTPLAQRVVLLVEDFEMMRGVLRGHLLRCGVQRVDAAASAKDAINLLRKQRYDVVLCDYNLGPGKNGQQLLEEARHHGWISAATVWLMITAEKSNDMVSVAAEQAPDDYLLKPITEATLQSRIQRLVERKAALTSVADAMKAAQYGRALRLCDEQLAAGSRNAADLLRLKAQTLELAGEPDKARTVYETVLQRAPLPWAKLGLAKLHLQGKRISAARALLEETVQEHPQFLDAYDLLAELLALQGAGEQELEVLQRAADISPNAPARQAALGNAALRLGERELAAQAFRRSIKLSEHSAIDNVDPYLGLARMNSEDGAPAEALHLLEQLLRKTDTHDARVLAKGEEVRAHHAAGDAAALAQALKEARAYTQPGGLPLRPELALRLADTLMQSGQSEDATQMLLTLTRNNHDDDTLLKRVQRVFDAAGMGERGGELLAAARRQATESMSEGVRLMAQGQLQAAIDSLRRAKQAMPQNARVLLNFAAVALTALEKQGWDEALATEARNAIDAARSLRPADARGAELLERLARLSG
jgi:DNA-binding response OmpR family regulator